MAQQVSSSWSVSRLIPPNTQAAPFANVQAFSPGVRKTELALRIGLMPAFVGLHDLGTVTAYFHHGNFVEDALFIRRA
jgi:hypothetical protein